MSVFVFCSVITDLYRFKKEISAIKMHQFLELLAHSPLIVYIFIASNYGRQVFVSTVRQRSGRQLLKCVDPEHIHNPPPPPFTEGSLL